MRIVSLVTQKGGTGKSTLAVNLAVVAQEGGEKVLILDLDPQGTSAHWYATRAADTPAVINHNEAGQLEHTIASLKQAGFTLAIIDTPGSDSHATRAAMRVADLCLVPVRPSEADMKATEPTIKALSGLGRPFAIVINQAPSTRQARLTLAVTLRLSTAGAVAPVALASRIDHQYAYALGLGVTEFSPKSKGAAEVAELWAWCRKHIEGISNDKQAKRRT